MKTLSHTVRFLTPAFLGNAEQNGQWRTPPFKALLRQWWRMAVAEELKYDVSVIRRREADLFGVAADGGDSHKSRVRIRLSRWDEGRLAKKDWQSLGKTKHPEVHASVGADLYLGYGPLEYNRDSRTTSLKKNAAIQAGEEAMFSLAFPEAYAAELEAALWLMNRYGTLGGRSRNGWGSFFLASANEHTPTLDGALPLRNWQDALKLDWPHALGSDGAPLIWQTGRQNDWKAVMVDLAKLKIDLRTQFRFNSGKNADSPEMRHWLSYPVTNHSVKVWGNNARLPNSLRFKIRQDETGKSHGVIFHVPCKPPQQFGSDENTLEAVWQRVHQYLDGLNAVSRIVK
ncbi:MAG: RAMP superfamily CRISPR-associated protein [Alcanivoracaceae bacterium]